MLFITETQVMETCMLSHVQSQRCHSPHQLLLGAEDFSLFSVLENWSEEHGVPSLTVSVHAKADVSSGS